MSKTESQVKKEFSFSELIEKIRQKAEEQHSQGEPEQKKGKGLEFMAYKLCVAKKHIELCVTKKITLAESNLLRLLEIGTIGAQNGRSQITDKAEFFISDLSAALGYKKKDKIWTILKSLEKKKYIVREKTRNKDAEILGLNPKVFDQILIDKHHEIAKKRHLKLAVDNTGNGVDNFADEPTNRRCGTDES